MFRISYPNKFKENESSRGDDDWKLSSQDVTAAAKELSDAVSGFRIRTPINHRPAKYHTRLSRIEKHLQKLSLDQMYQQYVGSGADKVDTLSIDIDANLKSLHDH